MDKWVYYLVRTLTYPFGFMPYWVLRPLAKVFGLIAYYSMKDFRKRTFSNLALAKDLNLSPKEIIALSKQSFQNLAMNALEYPKLSQQRSLKSSLVCTNPEESLKIYNSGKGIVFFCGHQSNWEVLFIDATSRIPGTAIGRPIKNKYLYDWVVSIRERNGGKMVAPKNAIKEGLRTLKKGHFMGIVGDQGMPGSGYSFPFLGRRAWTSPIPALLAYKTNSPIIFTNTNRVRNGFEVIHSKPIWPDLNQPMDREVIRMMDETMRYLEEAVKASPGEWLWQHNRWKQQTMHNLYKRFRQDCIAIILPEGDFSALLSTMKEIYTSAFLHLFVPAKYKNLPLVEADEIFYYDRIEETLKPDFRFKLVFNFTDFMPIHAHYENLSALEVLNLDTLKKIAEEHLLSHHTITDVLKRALCRPGAIWEKETHAS